MIKYREERPMLDRIDDFIEFAEATNKLADVAFYKEVKRHIIMLEDTVEALEKRG